MLAPGKDKTRQFLFQRKEKKMDGKELNALFGIEDEAQDGVVDQEGEVTDEGAGDLEDNELNLEGNADGVATHQQTPETNHQFAEARKAAEQEARAARAEAQAAQAETRMLQEALKGFGYEGSPQEIADAIEASRTQRSIEEVEAERLQRETEFNERIANHPDVVRARELAQEIVSQRNRELIANELKNIQRVNPEIKSIADLQNLGDDQDYFDFLVREKGLHIDEAYKKVMRGKGSSPAPQRVDTRENIQTFNGSEGATIVDIPRDEELLCMELNPGLTKEEIRKYYNKYKKGAR